MNSDGTDDGTLLKLIGRCITPFGQLYFIAGNYFSSASQANDSFVSGSACLCAISS